MDLKKSRTVSDFMVIILVTALYIILQYATPINRGFYCDDESIRYPYKGLTITGRQLLIFATVTGTVLILTTEYVLGRNKNFKINFSGFQVNEWIALAYNNCFDYIIYFFILQILFETIKLIGSLRPVFLDVCNPNIDLSDCSIYSHSYITNYTCQNTDVALVNEMRRSFLSGHAACSFFVMIFWNRYIQIKWNVDKYEFVRHWKHIVQCIITGIFLFIPLTRYIDNMHHPLDLICGSILGAAFGCFIIFYVSKFEEQGIKKDSESEGRFLLNPKEDKFKSYE